MHKGLQGREGVGLHTDYMVTCREQLAKHYINSGNHEMGEEEAMDAASAQTLQYRATCHKVASILNFTSLLAGGLV